MKLMRDITTIAATKPNKMVCFCALSLHGFWLWTVSLAHTGSGLTNIQSNLSNFYFTRDFPLSVCTLAHFDLSTFSCWWCWGGEFFIDFLAALLIYWTHYVCCSINSSQACHTLHWATRDTKNSGRIFTRPGRSNSKRHGPMNGYDPRVHATVS